MERYFYITKNLSPHLNGRIVLLNFRHENHRNLEGPIADSNIEERWQAQNRAHA